MFLTGKGFFIWQIPLSEEGSISTITALTQRANYTHLVIKIADGVSPYNVDLDTGEDLVPPLISSLRSVNITPLGWHYVYGYDPVKEAEIAVKRVKELGLDGYVIDAEAEYKQPGKSTAARQFMTLLRAELPDLPIALSSYRYPSYHPQLPWEEFLSRCDYNMPQVYWLQNHNPGEQLIRSVSEFQQITPFRPIIPTGAAFTQSGWSPTVADEIEFMDTAKLLNLSAVNFWEWSNARRFLPEVWDAISAYSWTPTPPPPDFTELFIDALNTHDPNIVLDFYQPNAVHVTGLRTIQGKDAIREWYLTFFNEMLPNATFTQSSHSGSGSTRHMTWTAVSRSGTVNNGNDTFGLLDNKIAYHYTFFTVR